MDYEQLLKKAQSELPEETKVHERFEIPKVSGHIQGNRTVISNFSQIAAALRRKPAHLLKFLLKELAAPGELKKSGLLLGRKVSSSMINDKIQQYANAFVICKECHKPDTKLVRQGRYLFIKCTACGARHPVQTKI
jgi:translation initiation factor 2 subunit 2